MFFIDYNSKISFLISIRPFHGGTRVTEMKEGEWTFDMLSSLTTMFSRQLRSVGCLPPLLPRLNPEYSHQWSQLVGLEGHASESVFQRCPSVHYLTSFGGGGVSSVFVSVYFLSPVRNLCRVLLLFGSLIDQSTSSNE